MRTTQEIFHAVIAARLYGAGKTQSWYMCRALEKAAAAGRITEDEAVHARKEIREYMQHSSFSVMRTTLKYHHPDAKVRRRMRSMTTSRFSTTVGRKFYLDWDNRPELNHAATYE